MISIKTTINTNIHYIGDTFESLSCKTIDHYLSNKFYLSYDNYENRIYWTTAINYPSKSVTIRSI